MTESTYLKRCPTEKWSELVDGDLVCLPSPSLDHAILHSFLLSLIGAFADNRALGKTFSGSYQVRFARQKVRRSPDIFFVSNRNLTLIRDRHLEGAPEMIVEIISPDSQSRDRREKFLEYQTAGVPEYWIVDPISRSLEAYSLGKDRKYRAIEPRDDGAILSQTLRGFYIKPDWLWRLKLAKVSTLLREMKRKR